MPREAPADAPADELEPGSLLGGYRIQGLLGRTAWASTYAAHADESEVAIKLAAGDASDDLIEELRTLRDEFRSTPGSLAALEEGRGGDPERPFFVTALCSEPSLADLVPVCPLTVDELVGLVTSLAKALSPLHDAGVGHLAIKPTNIFVGPPPDHDVTIGDLGSDLFRLASKSQHPWLAPEQIAAPGTGDPRTDVFAMGLVAFYALTGSTYWSSRDEASIGEEMDGARLPPSLRARDVGVELDPALDAVLLRALSTDPSARFATARAFAEALAVYGEATVGIAPEVAPPKAPPPSALRHLKATAKLVRFDFPLPNQPPPLPNRTVKMAKWEAAAPRESPTPPAPVSAPALVPSAPRSVPRFQMPEPQLQPEPKPPMRPAPTRAPWPWRSRNRLIALAVAGVVFVAVLVTLILALR